MAATQFGDRPPAPRGREALCVGLEFAARVERPALVQHDLQRVGGGLLFVSAEIDGRSVRALLDTGARSSLVTQRVAAGLGVTDDDLSRDPLVTGHGIGAGSVAFRRHRFDTVRVGGVTVQDMTVNIAPLPIAGVDMLLGADWLTGHRVWISPAAGRLFQR